MAESLFNKVGEFFKQNKNVALTLGGIAVLTAAKMYFRGGVCKADRDLRGKVVVVTGGSAGIGKETIRALSGKGCTIIFGARDKFKSDEVINTIISKNKDCRIFYFPLDLASKKSIQQFSKKVKENCQKIDILINNAGLLSSTRRLTQDGFELTMGANHLGHFYLTYHLWNLLKIADKPRIINVSSNAHEGMGIVKYNAAIDFEDFNYEHNYSFDLAYTRSKIANILFTRQLQLKINQSGLQASTFSLHPGVIPTDLARDFGLLSIAFKALFAPVMYVFFKTAWEGAQTTLYLALEDENNLQKGEYYKDCKRCPTSQFSTNMHNADRLWRLSEDLLRIKFDL